MDLSVKFMGQMFSNPLLPASGPIVGTLENLKFFENSKVGGIVTKTISVEAAIVKKPCIAGNNKMIFNSELWSEYHSSKWINEILPEISACKTKPMIVSVGYKCEDFETLIPQVDQYADMFEVSTHYTKSSLSDIVKSIRKHTEKPIFMKLSPHVTDYLHFVETVVAAGANGVVAINSLGPATVVDLKNRKILLGTDTGDVWMSGPCIKPVALNRIVNIKKAFPHVPVIAAGGVESAEDVLEFILAGADLVQMLSAALIKGRKLYDKIVDDMPKVLKKYKFESIEDLRESRTILLEDLDNRNVAERIPRIVFPLVDHDLCNRCGLCTEVCPEMALKIDGRVVVDKSVCQRCGLCQTRCPKEAISGVFE